MARKESVQPGNSGAGIAPVLHRDTADEAESPPLAAAELVYFLCSFEQAIRRALDRASAQKCAAARSDRNPALEPDRGVASPQLQHIERCLAGLSRRLRGQLRPAPRFKQASRFAPSGDNFPFAHHGRFRSCRSASLAQVFAAGYEVIQ
jgi:hypothetical protein